MEEEKKKADDRLTADSMKAVTVIPSIATVADGTRW